jgi:hypothetical protein
MPYCVGHSTTGNATRVGVVGVAETMADGDRGAVCTADDADGDDGAGVVGVGVGVGVDGVGVDGAGAGELGIVTTCEKPSRLECVLMAQPPTPMPPTTTAAAVAAATARRRRTTRDVRSDRSSRSAT